jgi:hypothetical protein
MGDDASGRPAAAPTHERELRSRNPLRGPLYGRLPGRLLALTVYAVMLVSPAGSRGPLRPEERGAPSWIHSERQAKAERVAIFTRAASTNNDVTRVLQELHSLKKPNSRYLAGRVEGGRLQSAAFVEELCGKHGASMFGAVSRTKRRSDHLMLGRLYDGKVLDQFGMRVRLGEAPPGAQLAALGATPFFVFLGHEWQADRRLSEFKNFLVDAFGVRLQGSVGVRRVERALVAAAFNTSHVHVSHHAVRRRPDGTVALEQCRRDLFLDFTAGAAPRAGSEPLRAPPRRPRARAGPRCPRACCAPPPPAGKAVAVERPAGLPRSGSGSSSGGGGGGGARGLRARGG